MSIGGIGSTASYYYNTETKKLQSANDNQDDAFVKWFNGEIADDALPDTMNGFDFNRKRDIKNMFMFLGSMPGGGKVCNDLNDNIYEIKSDVIDAITSEYSVDGKVVFTAYNAVAYTNAEIKQFATIDQPYRTNSARPYDPLTNSINIAVGDVFDLKNGYKLTVKEDYIYGEGFGNGSKADDEKTNLLIGGLGSLIHFADQQWFAGMISEESTPDLLELLHSLGVDTTKEFTINGTKCNVVNGRIREAGNHFVVPSSIFANAVKRYEEQLNQPLNKYSSK